MKSAAMFIAIMLVVLTGCSNDVGTKTGDGGGTAGDGKQSSPEAVVKAVFAEAKKDKPDTTAIQSLLSKDLFDELQKVGQFDGFVKKLGSVEFQEVGTVTMHDSGKYAKVEFSMLENGQPDNEKMPVIKVGDNWYLHNSFGPRESKSRRRAKSDSEGTTYKTARRKDPPKK